MLIKYGHNEVCLSCAVYAKVLFLDVLFPLNVRKILYIDADQARTPTRYHQTYRGLAEIIRLTVGSPHHHALTTPGSRGTRTDRLRRRDNFIELHYLCLAPLII